MTSVRPKLLEPMVPTIEEATIARESSRIFTALTSRKKSLRVKLSGNKRKEQEVVLPAFAVRLLIDILDEMARGNAVSIIPINAELTTQEAADVLNVSRPFLIKMIEDRKLPCRKVGRHRRIMFEDLMRCKHQMGADREKALDELAKQAQELDMGY